MQRKTWFLHDLTVLISSLHQDLPGETIFCLFNISTTGKNEPTRLTALDFISKKTIVSALRVYLQFTTEEFTIEVICDAEVLCAAKTCFFILSYIFAVTVLINASIIVILIRNMPFQSRLFWFSEAVSLIRIINSCSLVTTPENISRKILRVNTAKYACFF